LFLFALIFQTNREFKDSIISYQHALRVTPKNSLCWEELAEAYSGEGQYMAALKSYIRASELDPTNQIIQYQLAQTQLIIGMRMEAINGLEQIVGNIEQNKEMNPNEKSGNAAIN
jgi:tetratricopeptide (TPR) repeat protein